MSIPWAQARALAATFGPLGPVHAPLSTAVGSVLAADVVAVTDLPAFTVSAMDGWAVAGPPPWSVVGEVSAGEQPGVDLLPGQALRVATGAPVPAGTDSVLRSERGTESGHALVPDTGLAPAPGQDVRALGSECRAGDVVATAGQVVVPALLGLAAAAGADGLFVVRRPRLDLLVIGDELMGGGPASHGRIRDALTPMLVPWFGTLGAQVGSTARLPDTSAALLDAIDGSAADVVVTTGSTALGPRDHLHRVLRDLDATVEADGVEVRPGHPMVLARLGDGRPLVGLPGNPLAAVSGVLTLAAPVLRGLQGLAPLVRRTTVLDSDVPGHPVDVRLVPVRGGHPLHYIGPAMLRGLAQAEALVAIPPGGASAGTEVELLDLPA